MALPQKQTEYIGLIQAADMTGLSTQTLRKLIRENELAAYKAGVNIRLRLDDIEALMKPMNTKATTAQKSRKVS